MAKRANVLLPPNSSLGETQILNIANLWTGFSQNSTTTNRNANHPKEEKMFGNIVVTINSIESAETTIVVNQAARL